MEQSILSCAIDDTGGKLLINKSKGRYYVVIENKRTGYKDTMFGSTSKAKALRVFQQIRNVNL